MWFRNELSSLAEVSLYIRRVFSQLHSWQLFWGLSKKNVCAKDCCERFQAFAGLYLHPSSGCLGSIVWFATILGQHFSTIISDQDCIDVAWWGQSDGNRAASALWIKKPIYTVQQPRKGKILGKFYICWLGLSGLSKQEAHTWFLISIALVTPGTATVKWS